MSTSKLRKSFVVRFRRISIGQRKKAPEKPKDECIEKVRRKVPKPKSFAISALAGCRCQKGLDIDLYQIPANSQMPEVCSVQSLPSCSSSSPENKVEQCHERRPVSVTSFDEMLKCSSSSLHTEEVRYIHKSSIDNNGLVELQISPVKFNDMVTKFRRNEHDSSCASQPTTRGFSSPHRKAVNDSPTKSATKMLKTQVMNSLLIMKNSSDPQREFRDSMVEMIHENKISSRKDLEELLAFYLLLNSAAYHDVIIRVFKQIWADLIHARKI